MENRRSGAESLKTFRHPLLFVIYLRIKGGEVKYMFNYREMSAEQRAAFMQMTPHQRMEFKRERGVVEPESRTSYAGYFAPDAVKARNNARVTHELAFRGDIARASFGFERAISPNKVNKITEGAWSPTAEMTSQPVSRTRSGEFVIPSARPVAANVQVRHQA